jgi:hypothetical protein
MMATGSQTRSAEHPLGALVKQKFVPNWCSVLRFLQASFLFSVICQMRVSPYLERRQTILCA